MISCFIQWSAAAFATAMFLELDRILSESFQKTLVIEHLNKKFPCAGH